MKNRFYELFYYRNVNRQLCFWGIDSCLGAVMQFSRKQLLLQNRILAESARFGLTTYNLWCWFLNMTNLYQQIVNISPDSAHSQLVVVLVLEHDRHISRYCQHFPHSTVSPYSAHSQLGVMDLEYDQLISTYCQHFTTSIISPHTAHSQHVVVLILEHNQLISTYCQHFPHLNLPHIKLLIEC